MEKLYINGHKIYKEVSLSYILNRIENIKSLATTNLYIHGPFCINLCNFCQHQGVQLKNNLEILNQYYKVYLPGLIKDFETTIEQLSIDSIHFGGGTADLIPEEFMQQLFDCIPNFKSIPCKIFEAHPASLTSKQIDILHANNFDSGYISFGIQTFNKKITDNENRIYVSPDKILNKLNYI
jgi:coproporphyrinogen III oxidase-like Fe-S oxidoreductase